MVARSISAHRMGGSGTSRCLEDAFQDRPTGCTGGYDEKLQTFRPPAIAQYYLKPKAGKPFETVAVFVVPADVAATVQPTITWATTFPQYLAFPR